MPQHLPVMPTMAARFVRALLDRHGIPKHKHSATVAEILCLSGSQGARRLNSDAPWALEELTRLAQRFGETLASLVAPGEVAGLEPALIVIGTRQVDCRIQRGAPVHRPREGALVATTNEGQWFVTIVDAQLTTQAYDVERVVITPSPATRRGIAVLDDHQDSAASIVTYLRQQGFDAVAFTSLEQLAAVVSADAFDGYVLDWVIGPDTVRNLLASIRAKNAHCPIAVLTGHGVDRETDIAAAKSEFRFDYFDKPLRLPIIAASFTRAFTAP